MLELYGKLHVLVDVSSPERFKNNVQISLYPDHKDVEPPIQCAIYKFIFDVDAESVERYDRNDPSELNFGTFRKDHYFYRPNPSYGRPSPPLVSVELFTPAEIVASELIPKIEILITPDNPALMDMPEWWGAIWVDLALSKHAPKWICESYATKRIDNRFIATYIPATINRKQVVALESVRNTVSALIEATECNYMGVKRHLF